MKKSNYRNKNKPYGMKDGGRVNPNMLGIGMARDAGAALSGRQRQIDNAIDEATNPPVLASKPSIAGGLSSRRDGATPPAAMLAMQRRGMKDGGPVKYADGGPIKSQPNGGNVKGPGGPTDDKAGLYKLSNKEYILPPDTVDAMGGPDVLDEIRYATHEFVDESARGMANGGSEEEKRRMVRAGGSEIVQGMRPETRNYAELVKLQKPLTQSIGEGIGEAGGMIAKGIGATARRLEDTRKGALTIANNLPGAIAAPVTTAASNFGAAVRTGYTGQPQIGTEYVGRPLFDDAVPSAVAAPVAPAVKPSIARPVQPAPQANPVARQVVAPTVVAQPQTPVSAPPAPANNYGIGSFLASSNRADGKQNVFAGGTGGYGVNPADFNAATARAASDKAKLASLAVSGVNEGTTEGIDRAYRLAAGDPEATAAVDAAIKQRKLSSAALGGSKNAASIINQQNENDTRIGVANIGAKTDAAKLSIAQGVQDIQRRQFESNDAANQIDVKTKQAKLKDLEQATALRDQILGMKDDDPERAGLVKKFNLLSGKETGLSQKDLLDAFVQDSKARASNNEPPQDFQTFSRNITGQGGRAAPHPDAIALLRKNPAMASQFDAKYGSGSSSAYIGK